jgi:hypothetical protein
MEEECVRTKLAFLTEEGLTRSRNAARRIGAYAVVMFLFAGASGYVIHRYWVTENLTLLQRIYFKQYLRSSWKSALLSRKSRYAILVRTVTDPRNKKEVVLGVSDNDIVPKVDHEGRLQYDQCHFPILVLKDGIEHKRFYWAEDILPDMVAYDWFHRAIYDDQSLIDIWRPAWLGAILIFIFGTIGLTTVDSLAQRLYLQGEAIRGTRELSPKHYAREHRNEIGYGIKVFAAGGKQ